LPKEPKQAQLLLMTFLLVTFFQRKRAFKRNLQSFFIIESWVTIASAFAKATWAEQKQIVQFVLVPYKEPWEEQLIFVAFCH
jgi:hypothetical protein